MVLLVLVVEADGRLFHLLMLTSNSHSVDMNWYWNDDLRLSLQSSSSRIPSTCPTTRRPTCSSTARLTSPSAGVDYSGLDPLPLGASILEPDLDLDLAEFQLMSDLRSLRQRQILFAVELLLQFQQLFAREGRSSASVTPSSSSSDSSYSSSYSSTSASPVETSTRRRTVPLSTRLRMAVEVVGVAVDEVFA